MLKPGEKVHERYIVKSTLGEGGMSRVYLAEDERLPGREWALKEMDPGADPDNVQEMETQFRQEAEILCKLSHMNLPKITDFFIHGGSHYLVMEFVAGETLFDILEKTTGFIDEDTLRDWGVQIAEALGYLHSQNPPIIYRDIKPKNIIRTPEGKVKLIDFGIARLYSEGQATDTIIIGTPGFAPPEQYGRGQTDERSDIYSLGATLYNLATKLDPSDTPFCFSIPSTINPELSNAFDNAILKSINLKPPDRFQKATEFREALSLRHTQILPFLSSPSESSLSLDISETHVVFDLTDTKESAERVIKITNRGGKFLKASLASGAPWLSVRPGYFEANQQEILITIDLSKQKRQLKYRTKVILETEERSVPIQVTANIRPTVWDSVIPKVAVSAFLLSQSAVPLAAPFTIAYTYILFQREEKLVQKYPTWGALAVSVLNTLHFIGII